MGYLSSVRSRYVKMNIGQVLFSGVFMDWDRVEVHKPEKKENAANIQRS